MSSEDVESKASAQGLEFIPDKPPDGKPLKLDPHGYPLKPQPSGDPLGE
jgi:hypothetical protein